MNRLIIRAVLVSMLSGSFNYLEAQSLTPAWYSTDRRVCLSLDSLNRCAKINEFYEKEECFRIRYKVKGNQLTFKWYYNQTILGWQKWKSIFTIDEYSQRKLKLTLIASNNPILREIMAIGPGEYVTFTRDLDGCDNFWDE